MTKRKRETADEESATFEERTEFKKRKTSKIRLPQAKDPLNAPPNHLGSEGSTQLPPNSEIDRNARRLAKRERRAQGKLQRAGLERKDEARAGEDDKDTRLVKIRGTKSLKERQSVKAPGQHESRKREKEGGQTLRGKHKSKQEERRDKIIQTNGKKRKEKDIDTATWRVSNALGGHMLDVDPVFSPDEK